MGARGVIRDRKVRGEEAGDGGAEFHEIEVIDIAPGGRDRRVAEEFGNFHQILTVAQAGESKGMPQGVGSYAFGNGGISAEVTNDPANGPGIDSFKGMVGIGAKEEGVRSVCAAIGS